MHFLPVKVLLVSLFLCLFASTTFADERWEQLNNERLQYHMLGEYDEALVWAEKSLHYAKENLGLQHPKTLKSMMALANVHFYRAHYDLAEPLYRKALNLRETTLGKEDRDTLKSMIGLALNCDFQNRYSEAAALYEEALEISRRILGPKDIIRLRSTSELAAIYHYQGRYQLAASLFQESRELNKKVFGERDPETLRSMVDLATAHTSLTNYQLAEELLKEALQLSQDAKGENQLESILVMEKLGSLYVSQERYDLAEPLLQASLSLSEELQGKIHSSAVITMSVLADLYSKQGRYELAEPLLINAVKLNNTIYGESHYFSLDLKLSMGDLYLNQGRYQEAERVYKNIVLINPDRYSPLILVVKERLAWTYANQKRYDLAESLLVEVLNQRKAQFEETHPETLSTMNSLATVYVLQGNRRYAAAESLYLESLALITATSGINSLNLFASRVKLAWLYGKQDKDTLAEASFNKALRDYITDSPIRTKALNKFARFHYKTGQHTKAEALIDAVLPSTQAYLQQILWGAGEQTRQAYIQKQQSNNDFYLTLFNTHQSDANAQRALSLSLNRKGLLLQIATQIRAVSRSSQHPELAELAKSLEANRKQLASLSLSGEAEKDVLQQLQETVNQQQAKLGSKVQQLGRSSQAVSPAQVIASLDENSSFVDFIIYSPYTPASETLWQEEQLLAIVVNNQKEQAVQIVSLGKLAPIAQAIEQYRTILKHPNPLSDEDKAVSQKLYTALWQPLQSQLKDKETVYIAPDGILNLIPFSSLMDEQGNYLIEQRNLIMLSSGRDLVLPVLTGETSPPLIIAAPLYDDSQTDDYAQGKNQTRTAVTTARAVQDLYFGSLLGALKEGDALQAQLTAQQQSVHYLKLAQATEHAVAEIKSPRILHLATHGFYLEDIPELENNSKTAIGNQRGLDNLKPGPKSQKPKATGNPLLRSGLALVDANLAIKADNDTQQGILTAEEVLDLQLAGTQLVVLSACETGIGEIQTGEGVYGLRRSFQEAGAQSVLSTLWSISDEGTQYFMERFYQRLLENSPSQKSLRDTQLEFIQTPQWQHPFYWAAFVMVGQ